MVTDTPANQTAKVEQMQTIPGGDAFWDIPNEPLQCAPIAKNPGDDVARIYLCHPPGSKLQRVISRIIGKRANDNDVACTRFATRGYL